MEAFFVILVVVILLIRGLAKLGGATRDDQPRPRPHKQSSRPPGNTDVSRGAHQTSASASAKPGEAVQPNVRRPHFGRRKTLPAVQAPPQGPGSETYVRYLIDVLRVGEPAASREAVERLVELGRPALPVLQEAARDPSPFVRERAQQASRRILEALASPGVPEAVPDAIPLPLPARGQERRPALFEKRQPRRRRCPAPPPRADVPVAVDAPVEPEPEPVAVPEPVPAPEAKDEREAAPATPVFVDPSDVEALATVLRAAAAEPGFGGRRDQILEPLRFALVRFTVVVGRVQWTGSFGVSRDYQSGRTVGGRMAEVDLPVAVCLPAARNGYADALKEGDTFAFRGAFASWDGMYDRGKFEGDLLEEPVAQG